MSLSRCRPLQKTRTNQSTEKWSPVPLDTSTKQSYIQGTGNITEEGTERLPEPQDHILCFAIVSPTNVRRYIHRISTTWQPKNS